VPDKLMKHNVFPYCNLTDCEYFNNCGLAANETITQNAEDLGMEVAIVNVRACYKKREEENDDDKQV